jgi:pilus assembly protein CpaC
LALTLFTSWIGCSQAVLAQPESGPPVVEQVRPGEDVFQVLTRSSKLNLVELETRVVELPKRITVVDGFDQNIVNVTAIDPRRLRLRAEKPGVTTVKLTDEFGETFTVEVFVEGDIRELQAHLQRLFPESAVEAIRLRDSIVLRGWVTEPDQIPQVVEISSQFAPTIHNQMRVAGENQIQLNVRVMEVQRSQVMELGFNFLLVGQQYYVSSTPGGLVPIQSVTLPFGGPPSVTSLGSALANPTMQFAITGASDIFNGFIEALQRKSLLKVLAEPRLVTTSGRPASLLSGGEFPILVPQGLGTATIQWREFGVRMEAVPIVLGNGRLRLDIAPEVSERDFANAVEVNGFVVPGLTTRRVNTQVEMRFGDTLMIGGLISQRRTATKSEVPFLGEIPGLGLAFRREQNEIGETELLILVTPYLASPINAGQFPGNGPGLNSADPTAHEFYLDGYLEVDQVGAPYGACPPGQPGMITPAPAGMAPPTVAPPPMSAPAAPAPPPESVRRGGSAPRTGTAGRAPARSGPSEAPLTQRRTAPTSRTAPTAPSGRSAGLIQPNQTSASLPPLFRPTAAN